MKILESQVSLFSSHQKHTQMQESETLQMWNKEEDAPQRLQRGDRLQLSEEFKHLHKKGDVKTFDDESKDVALDPKLMSIVRALEALTGRKIDISFMKNVKASEIQAQKDAEGKSSDEPQRLGWGIDYRYEKTEIREESLKFSARGDVTTEDGKKIDFSLAFAMHNRLESHESLSFKAGDALIDPLVINFGSNTVNISDVKHSFDLDLDGKSDEFSFVGNGSGFLALDKNKDGIVNNGSELFGPKSGNGFDELSAYDSDANNWIDENDKVFGDLLIWTKDEEGNENLYTLQEKGIGAIYLKTASTEFEMLGSDLNTTAQLRESSIYLRENGGVGTVQELDLVV